MTPPPAAHFTPLSLPIFADLPVAQQRLSHAIRRNFTETWAVPLAHRHYIVAVSGGADSTALLVLLALWRQNTPLTLTAVHCDHHLRPESGTEADFVQRMCAACAIPCRKVDLDVQAEASRNGTGTEEAARRLRYAALEEARRACAADGICTGHHLRDLQEDMLMRLLRGTGWPALAGMDAIDTQRRLYRPLLHTAPEDLRTFLRALHMPWVEDASNEDTSYTRNRIRHTLLPLLERESPHLNEHMRELWNMARDDKAHWETTLTAKLHAAGVPSAPTETTPAPVPNAPPLAPPASPSPPIAAIPEAEVLPLEYLPAALLRDCDRATRMRLYVRAVRSLSVDRGEAGQARRKTLCQLDAALCAGRGGLCFQLPGGITATLRQGAVRFSRATQAHTPDDTQT